MLTLHGSACCRNFIALYGSIGGKLSGLRFRARNLRVTTAAKAVKLMHPNNKKNLITVLPLQMSTEQIARPGAGHKSTSQRDPEGLSEKCVTKSKSGQRWMVPQFQMSHRPLWISNLTKPSSRIFKRRAWQASAFATLARLVIWWTLSGFSPSALRIFSRSFSTGGAPNH